jgi:UDP-GlcNAc:undecaprenyl-phosphate GlcNAc-1-phosphate transferase
VREYLLTLLLTAGVTYLLTPLVRRGAIAVGAMHAGRERDVHVQPIPLLGGLAMYGGFAAGLLVASRISPLRSVFVDSRMAAGLLLAGGLIVLVGFVDDRWGLNPISKAAGQVAAGGILVWSGAEVSWLPEPGGGTLALTPDQATALTILVVVVTINAVNFIDGLDGLAAGIVGIAALSFFVYYYTLTRVEHLPEQAVPTLASALLAGACIGFVPHNFYPARIFMGDTGSMLLGLLLAYAPISSISSLDYATLHATVNRFPEILPLIPPAAILIIPYADLVLAVVRRTRAGRSPFSPDRMHLHHRLLDFGHSHRSSVLIMYLWTTLFSGTVVWLSIAKTPLYILAVVTVVSVLALLLMSMPRFRWWERRRPPGQRRPGGRPPSRGAQHAAQPVAAGQPAAGPGQPG